MAFCWWICQRSGNLGIHYMDFNNFTWKNCGLFYVQIEFYFYYNGGKHKKVTQHYTYSTSAFIADIGGYMVTKIESNNTCVEEPLFKFSWLAGPLLGSESPHHLWFHCQACLKRREMRLRETLWTLLQTINSFDNAARFLSYKWNLLCTVTRINLRNIEF